MPEAEDEEEDEGQDDGPGPLCLGGALASAGQQQLRGRGCASSPRAGLCQHGEWLPPFTYSSARQSSSRAQVSTDERHFEAVAAATEVLAQNGRVPVPHVPASRFRRSSHPHPPLGGGGGGSSDEDAAAHPGSEEVVGALPALDATLRRLCLAGGERVMLVGGNDQYERRAEAFESAGELLRTGALRRAGFRGVVLAGHPEGHVGLGGCRVATRELLISKVREASAQGLEVAVATQLCFDGDALTRWLAETRALVVRVAAGRPPVCTRPLRSPAAPHTAGWRAIDCKSPVQCTCVQRRKLRCACTSSLQAPTPVTFHVGVPGPTTRQKLARIAAICEVRTGAGAGPSTFVGNSEPVEQQEHQQQKQDEEGDVSGGLVWPTALVSVFIAPPTWWAEMDCRFCLLCMPHPYVGGTG